MTVALSKWTGYKHIHKHKHVTASEIRYHWCINIRYQYTHQGCSNTTTSVGGKKLILSNSIMCIRVLFSFQKVSHSTYRCTNKATGRSERLSVSMPVTTELEMTDVPGCGSYLEDRDSPMKISLRLRMGRRLVLEKLSCTFPLPGEMRCVDQI